MLLPSVEWMTLAKRTWHKISDKYCDKTKTIEVVKLSQIYPETYEFTTRQIQSVYYLKTKLPCCSLQQTIPLMFKKPNSNFYSERSCVLNLVMLNLEHVC